MLNNILANKRIFVIEGDCDQVLMITNVLMFYGALAPFDQTGRDVTRRLLQHRPLDLILLDLTPPSGFSGYDLLAQIRAHPLLRNLPVVALSALDPAIEIPKAQEAGFAGLIRKPIAFEEFADQLLDVLNGQQVWVSNSQLVPGD